MAAQRGLDDRRPRRILRDLLAELSQIHHRYGTLADSVLSGHRTKCFFAGADDLTTTRYLTRLLGSEYVSRTSVSNDVPQLLGGGRNGSRRSISAANSASSSPRPTRSAR